MTDFLEPNSANIMETTMRTALSSSVEPKPMLLAFKLPSVGGMPAVLQLLEARDRGEEHALITHNREVLVFSQLSWSSTSGKVGGVVLTGRDMSMHKAVMHSLGYSSAGSGTGLAASHTAGHAVAVAYAGAPDRGAVAVAYAGAPGGEQGGGGGGGQGVDDEHDEHDEYLARVITNAVVPVASVDCAGRVQHWNTRMEVVTGLDSKQAQGKLLVGDLFSSKARLVLSSSAQLPPTALTPFPCVHIDGARPPSLSSAHLPH
jgi:PAS domain-containing protein